MIRFQKMILFCSTIIWVAAVTYASLKAPSMKPPPFFLDFPNSDKLIHFCMYFGMAFWLFYSLISVRSRYRYLVAFTLSVVYGIFMEIMQDVMAIGRSMDVWDAVANATGAAIFLLASAYIDVFLVKIFSPLIKVKSSK